MANGTKSVTIYTTPTCVYCNAAKKFFAEHGVAYQEHNVLTDMAKRNEMFAKSGQMGVPVIIVGDEIIVGFDRGRLQKVLGI